MKKITIGLIFALTVTVWLLAPKKSLAACQTTTINLPASYDNEVNSRYADTVYAGGVYATVGHWDYYNSTHRYFINFDLTQLEKKAKVFRAELVLDRVSKTWDQDNNFNLFKVLKSWRTNTLTWNNQPDVSTEFVVGVNSQYGLYRFNVLDWIVKVNNKITKKFYGFMLRKPNESGNNNGLFATVNYPTSGAETRPYLQVEYEVCGK